MANVQHLCDIGQVGSFIIEQPIKGIIRVIVMSDEATVSDIREFADTAPISMITGVSDRTSGPKVLATWGPIFGRAKNVNAMVRKAIEQRPQ